MSQCPVDPCRCDEGAGRQRASVALSPLADSGRFFAGAGSTVWGVGAALGFGGGCGLTPTLNLTSKLNLWVLLRGAAAALPSSQRSREMINERQEDQG